MKIVCKALKSEGIILRHIVKEICKGIQVLSHNGYTHGSIKLSDTCFKMK